MRKNAKLVQLQLTDINSDWTEEWPCRDRIQRHNRGRIQWGNLMGKPEQAEGPEVAAKILVLPSRRRAIKHTSAENIEAARARPRGISPGFLLNSLQISGREFLFVFLPVLLGFGFSAMALYDLHRILHPNNPVEFIALSLACALVLGYMLSRNLWRVHFMRTQAIALGNLIGIEHSQRQVKVRVRNVDGEITMHSGKYTFQFETEDGITVVSTFIPNGLRPLLLDQEREVLFYDPKNPMRCMPMDIFDGPVGISSSGRLVSRSVLYGYVRPLFYSIAMLGNLAVAVLAFLQLQGLLGP